MCQVSRGVTSKRLAQTAVCIRGQSASCRTPLQGATRLGPARVAVATSQIRLNRAGQMGEQTNTVTIQYLIGVVVPRIVFAALWLRGLILPETSHSSINRSVSLLVSRQQRASVG